VSGPPRVARSLRRRTLVVGGAAALVGARAAAAEALDAPPPPGPPRPLRLPGLVEERLPNGLTVIVAPRPGLPLVTATVAVRAGAEADPPGRAGLASATATLLARGAVRDGQPVGASALARQAEALGSALDVGSGWRLARTSMTVSTPRLDAALGLLADVVRRPLLAAYELEVWRQQTLDDLALARADPSAVAAQVARRLHWGASAYGAVVTPTSVRRLARADLRAFHRSWVRPERTLVVLAGDVAPPQALALARRRLGGWPAPAAAMPPDEAGAAQPLPLHDVLVDMPGAGQSSVVLAAPWVASGDAERRVAEVAAAVLGGGYSSRLNQQIRIRRGLSYGVFGDGESLPAGGWWSAAAQTDHANAGQVLHLLRDEMRRLADEPPAADELTARQAALLGGFARRWETTAGIAATLASHWASDQPWAALEAYADEVQAVTAEQVRDFAGRRWRDEALQAVVVGDLDAAGGALAAAAAGAWRVPLAALDFDRTDLGAGR
jgi:zinc protease